MNRRVAELSTAFSDREGDASSAAGSNRASRWFPRPVFWLAVGLVAVADPAARGVATPLVLTAAALLVLLGTSLAVPAAAEYSTPVAPAFICSPSRLLARAPRRSGLEASATSYRVGWP